MKLGHRRRQTVQLRRRQAAPEGVSVVGMTVTEVRKFRPPGRPHRDLPGHQARSTSAQVGRSAVVDDADVAAVTGMPSSRRQDRQDPVTVWVWVTNVDELVRIALARPAPDAV